MELPRAACDASIVEGANALEDVGRARRVACVEGELWRLPANDAPLAGRLIDLGASGVGGFLRGGIDDEGVWLVRRVPARRLDGLAPGEKLAWEPALGRLRRLAEALAACEKRALFPGPLRPEGIAIEPEPVWLPCERLIASWVGEVEIARDTSTAPSPRWTPPEQLDGAAWDGAANRYVLGLATYRMIAGEHPLGRGSMREAAARQASVPPFTEAIAAALRPGVQSLVLSLLDPDPARRPRSARSIVERCDALLLRDEVPRLERGGAGVKARRRRESASKGARAPSAEPRATSGEGASRSATRASEPKRTRPRLDWRTLAPLGAGLCLGGAALAASFAGSSKESPDRPKIAAERPLVETASKECASCHARETAEWQRSVMAHAAKSPLFGALESAVEEQVGRSATCPNGAGVLRRAGAGSCVDERTGIAVTGSGGEHWCVNCHAMGENLDPRMPRWAANGDAESRRPLRDLLPASSMEGISCAGCHQTIGPVGPHAGARGGAYEGNPIWTSTRTGLAFPMRPEDREGRSGIANSGYRLEPSSFLLGRALLDGGARVHRLPPPSVDRYLGSSEFCGACHDVRLFGTDVLGGLEKGEHFKRLRNAYSEWRAWAEDRERAGKPAATCQGCHMSTFPGVCEPGERATPAATSVASVCPKGTHFSARPAASPGGREVTHYFTSVEVPMTPGYPDDLADARGVDARGLPTGLEARRTMLLRSAFRFEIGAPKHEGSRLEIPIEIENVGAGHRVPAGFSQEREIWVELEVKDARGEVVYRVGEVRSDEDDLRDKIFLRVSTREAQFDAAGRPLGVFGADVVDGPDVPDWIPLDVPSARDGGPPSTARARGATRFRGRGLINLQNGFLRCVRCIGVVDASGRCQPGPGQGRTRADRFEDADYDIETGECRSNLSDGFELFETYFPVGALDADRGVTKAPDAILDTRSAPPGRPLVYTYDLAVGGRPGPFTVDARLRFRAFPPFLVKAFADYEAHQATAGLRPSGAQVTRAMLERLRIVDLAEAHARAE